MRSWNGLCCSTWGIWCSSLAPPDGHLWLPTPRHIEGARRLKDAQQWEAEAKKQRATAARDRLAAAITVDTAEATAEDLIRNHAGDARAFPSFVDQGIGLAASRAAVDQLRPHVKRYHVAERNHREKARTDQQHLDAVKRAVEGFRQWWCGGGLFRRKGAGETIVKQVNAAVWPTHWKETEAEHERITGAYGG